MTKPDVVRLICYLAAFGAALIYPVKKVMSIECPATPPEIYVFKAEACDPYDPMRGRYVALSLLPTRVRTDMPDDRRIRGLRQYAVLNRGADGFATVTALVDDPGRLPPGTDYVRVRYFWHGKTWDNKTRRSGKPYYFHFGLPFNRYYINEKLAPELDGLLGNLTRSRAHRAALAVAVFPGGDYYVRDLLIDGEPVRKVLERLDTSR